MFGTKNKEINEKKTFAREKTVILPSSFPDEPKEVTIRRPKNKDYDIILDEKYRKKGENFDRFLSANTGLPLEQIQNMFMGDRFFLMVEIRKMKNPVYETPVFNKRTGENETVEIDLNDLRLQKANPELLKKDGKDLVFECFLPYQNVKVIGKLLKGPDEKKLEKIQKKNSNKLWSNQMMLRVKEIEGRSHKNIHFFEDLDSEDTEIFNQKYEKADIGYDTRCKGVGEDGHEFEYDLPLDQAFFLGKAG